MKGIMVHAKDFNSFSISNGKYLVLAVEADNWICLLEVLLAAVGRTVVGRHTLGQKTS